VADRVIDSGEARTAIDAWFADRSVDDQVALDAFRSMALSPTTSAGELADLRLRFVDYLMAARGLDRAAAVKIAEVRMESWFAGAREARTRDSVVVPAAHLIARAAVYGAFAAVVGWVIVRLARGDGFAVAGWFWVAEIVASVALAMLLVPRVRDGLVRPLYLLTPVVVTLALLIVG
jgi:hypothetical protein